MPVVREPLSVSDLAARLGVEAWRLIDVEVNLLRGTANLVLQPPDRDPATLHPPVAQDVLCAAHARPLRECRALFHG